MSEEEGFERKGRRMAAIEAAKRIKKNAEENNMHTRRGRKEKTWDQDFDSLEMHNHIFKSSDSLTSEDMPKNRRGRPPKSKSPNCSSKRGTNVKYKDLRRVADDYDANLRRESYNKKFLLNHKPKVAPIFSGHKQLHFVNSDFRYKESLMKFTKDLGPTAQKVAHRMLQGQGLTQHQLDPMLQSRYPQMHTSLMDMNSINGSVRNTIPNQVNQRMTSIVNSNIDAIAKNKGKMIMIDDGKNINNKWDAADNLEFLFGKQKGGVKIGSGSSDNNDLGNRRTINQIGMSRSNYNLDLNQNAQKILEFEEIIAQKEVLRKVGETSASNLKPNSSVYPSTYVSHTRNTSSSYPRLDGEVSPFSLVPQPPMHSHTPIQPPQNLCVPARTTATSSVVNDSSWKEQELQLSLALNNKIKDQDSSVGSRNMWAPNQFQHVREPQDKLLTLMPPNFWSHVAISRAIFMQDPLPFGTQHDSEFQMGKHLQHPPPGI